MPPETTTPGPVSASPERPGKIRRGDHRPFLVGIALGAILMWVLSAMFDVGVPGHNRVDVFEGTITAVNYDRTAIGFQRDDGETTGYDISRVHWAGPNDVWHDDSPTCISRRSVGDRVTLGVIDAPPVSPAEVGGPIVVWIMCRGA